MSLYDEEGRIHKQAFLTSNLVLFIICLISVCARFYIRVRIQKRFSADDGILLFGVCCLICAMVLLFIFVDRMYLVEASESGIPGIELPPDIMGQAYEYQKLLDIALILTWCSIVAVKFSYLSLFKKLIDGLRPMVVYWWFVVVFNAIISAYGATVYIANCPKFYNIRVLQCTFGHGLQRSIALSVSQMILDIVGDLLILYIPSRLIWGIKVRWPQKAALSSCLCLTILTIMCTIIRISGIHTSRTVKAIDSVWETYWQFIAANIALTMTAATAFRTFFLSRVKDRAPQAPRAKDTLYSKAGRLLRSTFSPRSWRSKASADSPGDGNESNIPIELPYQIPGGTMTSIRTFINSHGRAKVNESQIMHSMVKEEHEDPWPLSTSSKAIKVQQAITQTSDDAC
ncbi:MAG: hypothetical protein FRX48_09227 [Lasallia pustulata]|uniref:Rhodopsin domain-containing protein n=1 Tax=Lasallia pustulata TaxID=136370 RepID=A0A5M8PCA2_9LECA|nr:MAG: hypothetical protein FRX48_09227 [Lasallia pustulata]